MALHEPIEVDGTAEQVRQRIADRLCEVGDLWFPTRGEMKRWDASASPLYVKWTRGGFEIGPRLETIPAARLAPALHGRLEASGTGRTRIVVRLGWPRLTTWVLAGFAVALGAWGAYVAVQMVQGTTHLGWVGTWVVSTLLVFGSAGISWRWGRARLLEDLPWLEAVLARPVVVGEDW